MNTNRDHPPPAITITVQEQPAAAHHERWIACATKGETPNRMICTYTYAKQPVRRELTDFVDWAWQQFDRMECARAETAQQSDMRAAGGPEPVRQRCGNCRFFDRGDIRGYCKRRAPTLTPHGTGTYPLVDQAHWCGEWEAEKDTDAGDGHGR